MGHHILTVRVQASNAFDCGVEHNSTIGDCMNSPWRSPVPLAPLARSQVCAGICTHQYQHRLRVALHRLLDVKYARHVCVSPGSGQIQCKHRGINSTHLCSLVLEAAQEFVKYGIPTFKCLLKVPRSRRICSRREFGGAGDMQRRNKGGQEGLEELNEQCLERK